MVILGGILQPQSEMNSPARWCSNAMPSRWSFEGLLLLESVERSKSPTPDVPVANAPQAPSKPSVDIAEAYFPKKTDRMGARACVFALSTMLVLLVLTIQTAFRSRDVH